METRGDAAGGAGAERWHQGVDEAGGGAEGHEQAEAGRVAHVAQIGLADIARMVQEGVPNQPADSPHGVPRSDRSLCLRRGWRTDVDWFF